MRLIHRLIAGIGGGGSDGFFPGIAESTLYLPLTHTLVPTRGSSTPTFARLTNAWEFDNEGKLILVPSSAARFGGARLVRNRIANSNPSSASWTLTNSTAPQAADPFGGNTAAVFTVTTNAGNTIRPTSNYSFTGSNTASFYFQPGTADWCRFLIYDGSGNQAKFWFNALTKTIGTISTGGAGWTAISASISNEGNGWFRLQALVTISGTTYFQLNICDADNTTNYTAVSGKTITIAFPQSEDVSGQVDQTASEYVSVGVLSSPYHGAGTASGADGCKWFKTHKNGSAITNLRGYRAEPARTNNCLWGRDITNAVWTKSSITAAKTATGLDAVANSASRLTSGATDATITQLLTSATGSRAFSAWIKRVSGTGTVSLTRNGGTSWTDITSSLVTGTWVPVSMVSDVGTNATVGIKMGTSGDVIDVDCCQDETGAWRTSPIVTTTAAVTRNSDVLSYASAFDVTQGTALCTCSSDSPINTAQIDMFRGDTSGRIMYTTSNVERTVVVTYDGVNITTATAGSINTAPRKRAVRWGADLRAANEGTLGTSVAFDGGMGASTTLYVGCNEVGTGNLSGYIGEVHIWNPTQLTNAQMQQVTS